MNRPAFLLVLVLSLLPFSVMSQQSAKATVEAHVNEVLKVLGNPALTEEQKKAAVKVEAEKLFDFVELAKGTLGLSWNRFSMEQRKEFVLLYRELLEQTYIDRMTIYVGEIAVETHFARVRFTSEAPLDSNAVEVRCEVVSKTGSATVAVRLINKTGQWKVYDVVVEGVSLVATYRSQFREMLVNGNPEALLKTLRQKVKEELR